MEAFKKLLKYHMDKDEDVFVKVVDTTIPVKLGVIKSTLPVMKTALENSLQEENRDDKVVFINDFELCTVQSFFFLLNEDSWPQYDWESLVNLVKFAHFYQATTVLNEIVKHSQSLVNIDNIYEVIEMIELFELIGWNAKVLEIFQKHIKSILKNEKYEHIMNSCPKTLVQLLNCMRKHRCRIKLPDHFCSSDKSNISNIPNVKQVIMQSYLNQDSTVTVINPNNNSDPFIIPVSVIHCLLPVLDQMVSADANNVVLRNDFEDMHMKLFFDILTRNKFPEDRSWENVVCLIKISYFFQAKEFLNDYFVNGGKVLKFFCPEQISEAIELAFVYGVDCEGVDIWYEEIHNKICEYEKKIGYFSDRRMDELIDKYPKGMIKVFNRLVSSYHFKE